MSFSLQSDHIHILCYRFDFCQDTKERRPSENLGQVLFGERIESSPYKVGTLVFLLPSYLKYIHNVFTSLIGLCELSDSVFVFQFKFNQNIQCKQVCTKTYKKGARQDMAKLDFLKMGMQLNYQHHWLVFIRFYCEMS